MAWRSRMVWVGAAALVVSTSAGLVAPASADTLSPAPAPTVTPGVTSLMVEWDPADPAYPVPVGIRTYTVELSLPKWHRHWNAGGDSSLAITGLNPATAFVATVHAFDDGTEVMTSVPSSPVQPVMPAAPAKVSVVPGNKQVTVSWAVSAGAGGYVVFRDGAEVGTTSRRVATFVDTGLTNGIVHRYRVVARSGFFHPRRGMATSGSTASSPRSFVRPATTPKAPTGLTGIANDRSALLRWTATPAADNGGQAVTNYVVVLGNSRVLPPCRSGVTDPCSSLPPGATAAWPSRLVLNLGPENAYRFRVRAENVMGQSGNSGRTKPIRPTAVSPPFSMGMRGRSITALQQRLMWAGLGDHVTGVFDSETRSQVRHLQGKFLYDQTGVVGPGTWSLLNRITRDKGVLPASCLSDSLCISKTQRILRKVVNGVVVRTVDARFGPEGDEDLATAEGLFSVDYKDGCSDGASPSSYESMMAHCHVSTEYKTPMPWSLFFNGGQAVHYSYYFNQDGYWGNSHGCVNVRDWDGVYWIYQNTPVGTPVYVYW